MRRLRTVTVLLGLLLQPTTPWAQASVDETVALFGPNSFTRSTGAPTKQTASISVPGDVHGPFHITIQNGSTGGSGRVSSARITLNGLQLFGPADFEKSATLLERDVALNAANTLVVELASAPGSFLTISVTGKRTPQTLSSVGLTRGSPASIITNTPTQLTVTSIINDESVIPGTVMLERLNADGSSFALGSLHDDGLGGDAALGDHIFTAVVTLNESIPVELRFRVTAGFSGPPARTDFSEPFSIFAQAPSLPETTLSQLAADLAAGNIEAALTHFSAAARHRRLLSGLTPTQRTALVTALGAAHRATSQDDMTVFEVPWQDDSGNPLSLKIALGRTRTGEWVIISW
jgi:hypothetical protein